MIPPLKKQNLIHDQRRISYLNALYNRIYRGKSVLIEGDYGVGKSQFLTLIESKKLKLISLESLDKTHELLASILQQLNFDEKPAYHLMSQHLRQINGLSGFALLVDEANDLDHRVWPYFKRMIDSQIPIVMTGSPKLRTYLANSHPDILSRLKVLVLHPITVNDFIQHYQNFEVQAIEQIYISSNSDMRRFKEICTDCQDKADELKLKKIDINLAMSFLSTYSVN